MSAGGERKGGQRPVAVTVIDTGVGNLGNLGRALSHLGASVTVTSEPRQIEGARCLVLPGVGAFRPPRERLRGGMEAALATSLGEGAWLLGICVGFQLLFEVGEEFGVVDGLALLPGRVRRLPAGVPLPHIGWNRLHDLAQHPLLAGLEALAGDADLLAGGAETPAGEATRDPRRGRHMYFVHSFAAEGVPAEMCLAQATHGRSFVAVGGRDRVLGTQFHPERSGAAGLRLLANFLEMADGTPSRD